MSFFSSFSIILNLKQISYYKKGSDNLAP